MNSLPRFLAFSFVSHPLIGHHVPMDVVSYTDVEEFWRVAAPAFTADPVRNTVAITALAQLRENIGFGDEQLWLFTLHEANQLVGAVFRTPPWPLGLGTLPAAAIPALVSHLIANDLCPPNAIGVQAGVETFVSAWTEATGAISALHTNLRLYQLGELRPPTDVPGEFTLLGLDASDDDLDLLARWYTAFVREAAPGRDVHSSPASLRALITMGTAHGFWRVAGEPVSLAVATSPCEGVSRVAPVYTPPEFRGHGYGCAVTAAISQWALEAGAEQVVLFTDLANPVANSIYQRIGYRPIDDFREVDFSYPG